MKYTYVYDNIDIVNQLLPKHKLLHIRKNLKDENSIVYIFDKSAQEDLDKILEYYK